MKRQAWLEPALLPIATPTGVLPLPGTHDPEPTTPPYCITAFLQTELFLDYLFRKKKQQQRQFRFGDHMTSG